jgi:PmbA protein
MYDILENAKKVVKEAEVFKIKGIDLPIQFKANKFYAAERKDYDGVGLRVINKGRLGFSHTTKLEACGAIIDFAKDASRYGERAHFTFPGKRKFPDVKIESKSVLSVKTEDIKEHCRSFINEILLKEPDAKVDLDYSKGEVTVHIGNTSGLDVKYHKTFASIFARVFLVNEGSFAWIFRYKVSAKKTAFKKRDIREIIKEIEYARKVVPVQSGKMSVIFQPHVMMIPLTAISLGINGTSIQKGTSPLKNKKNRKVLDKGVTIFDDALLAYGVKTRPCDDEGVPSRELPIFKNGVLKHFIYDLQTAGKLNEKSTGSAHRAFNEIPQPGISNLVVSPGKWSLAEMVRDIKDGIIVHHGIGGGQSNMLAGDFSFNVSMGFKIKNGKIVGRVKNTMIAGNAYDIMNSIVGIGKKVENLGGIHTPAFCFKDVSVCSKPYGKQNKRAVH